MKTIYAYYYPRSEEKPSLEKFKGIDYLNYSFGLVKDGVLDKKRLGLMDDIINLEGRKFKITLSIGGWGADGFSDAVLTKESREAFISSIIDYFKEKKLDGIDIDWEYPGIPGGGIKARKEDTVNFTLFIKELKDEMTKVNPNSILTVAVGASKECADKLECDKLDKIIDCLNIMTYDMQSSRINYCHHTNLYKSDKSNISAEEAVKIFNKAGFSIDKMVIGCAFYGKYRSIIKDKKLARDGYSYKDIVKLEGFEYQFDNEAMAPLLVKDDEYITFDDVNSIKAKCDYINKYNLKGIMFWELNGDNGDLVKTMNNNLK